MAIFRYCINITSIGILACLSQFFMKRKFLLLILLVPVFGFTPNPLMYVRNHEKIEKLLVCFPVSRITILGAKSAKLPDSSLTAKAFSAAEKELHDLIPDSVEHSYFSLDSAHQTTIDNFVINLSNKLVSSDQVSKYKIPDSIIQVFSAANADFVFCISNTGFLRTNQNFTNSYGAGEAASLMIGIGWRPVAYGATINCFVLDLRKKNIVFFEREIWKKRDPTDPTVINLQFTKVINHCFL